MLSKFYIILIILLFKIILLEVCLEEPKSRNECFSVSHAGSYCCYNGEKCISIKKEELGDDPKLDCGITEENYGEYEFDEYHPKQDIGVEMGLQTCGKQKPENVEDCTEYSELSNSCCFFKNGDKQGCFLIGKKYDKDHVKADFTFGESSLSYDCKSSNIIFNMYSILLLLLFIN